MQSRIGMTFQNGIGNFIFFSAAIKILKKWGYKDIDLYTIKSFIDNPALMEVSEGLFTNINLGVPNIEDYTNFLLCGWSKPLWVDAHSIYNGWMIRNLITNNFTLNGIHEVQLYLNMIGASWDDFDGYMLEPDEEPILESERPRIALANPDPKRSKQAEFKSWDKFPELSKLLIKMGFTVILLGSEGELEGCEGVDFRGRLTIRQSAKVLEQCDMLIAPSTCLAVVADAVATPVLHLEGPIIGSKTHPLISPYRVVRHYISCAPCFQTKLMNFCDDNICMKSIEVKDVIQKMFNFLEDLEKDDINKQHFEYMPRSLFVGEEMTCQGTVAYLFPCYNRYQILVECLESFKASHPQEGAMLFLNDASVDPRVDEYIKNFEVDGLVKYVYQTDPIKKLMLHSSYRKSPSTHAYNRLLTEILKLQESGTIFDYLSIIDPDAIFKDYWSQKVIRTYKEAKKVFNNLGLMSGFNYVNHPVYDDDKSKSVYASSVGEYRLRLGANLHYMMTMKFFEEVHGLYPLDNSTPSADVSKNDELSKHGYRTVVTVPSVMQQIGAFGSSFSRLKSNEVVLDY